MFENIKAYRKERRDNFNLLSLTFAYLIYQLIKLIVGLTLGEQIKDIFEWLGILFNVILAVTSLKFYFKYRGEMIENEKKDNKFREEWKEHEEMLKRAGIHPIPQFNHRKARIQIAVLTYAAVFINAVTTVITILDLI